MNRRDIIIVAVLINAGLLVTLFVSSLKSSSKTDLAQITPPQEQINVAAKLSPQSNFKGDQVDQVISQYTALAKQETKKEESPLPPPVLAPPKKEEEKKPVFKAPVKMVERVVTVEKGDVLEKIARTHGVSVDEIMKLNKLSNSRLQIGQELILPEKKVSKPEPAAEEGKYYVVKGGDSPWTIAQKHHMQVEELLRLNNIDEAKAKRLRPGDRLKIK